MGEQLKILGICGSLRAGSFNLAALNAAVVLCPDDAEVEIYDISGFPAFNQDLEQSPPGKVTEFKAAIRASDAVVFSSPEYNYSMPGHLKNAIDWASRPYGDSAWDGKPALIMGASPGTGGTMRMQYHLRQTMVFLNMHPINRPEVMISKCAEKFDEQGNLTDQSTREHIAEALDALITWTRKLKG
jgi:chromate reductase